MLRTALFVTLLTASVAVLAEPMYIGQKQINMRQSQCIDAGAHAMEAAGMFSVEVVGGVTVFSSDAPYYAAISCMADNGLAVIVVSGPNPNERVQVYQNIERRFGSRGWRNH